MSRALSGLPDWAGVGSVGGLILMEMRSGDGWIMGEIGLHCGAS